MDAAPPLPASSGSHESTARAQNQGDSLHHKPEISKQSSAITANTNDISTQYHPAELTSARHADHDVRQAISRLMTHCEAEPREKEPAPISASNSNDEPLPLRLLDLPLDLLQMIMREVIGTRIPSQPAMLNPTQKVTDTNDLVALARTHSALHNLVIPQIYSRFDIVWPDTSVDSDARIGVDALTFGLATLVMTEDVFGNASTQPLASPDAHCTQCSHCNTPAGNIQESSKTKRRRGNKYAQFTRKFALGNGPRHWIKDYSADTDTGKMLGVLAGLAIARMRNLETFIWDMPTGTTSEVWNALASLNEHNDGRPCRLEKVWVRQNPTVIEGKDQVIPVLHDPHSFWKPLSQDYSVEDLECVKRVKVERPTFSALSPLKSLNVLDIDECVHLDEMSILISKSRHILRELRVGIAAHAVADEWAVPHHDTGLDLCQVAQGISRFSGNISMFEKRLGGVLGILLGYTYDLSREVAKLASDPETLSPGGTSSAHDGSLTSPADNRSSQLPKDAASDARRSLGTNSPLNLEELALERISLSIPILARGFNWTCLREITLLDCQYTASLWQHLRRAFNPSSNQSLDSKHDAHDPAQLNFRLIHTNTVTPQLLAFIKECLPANTLEALLLQQSEFYLSKVTGDDLMRCVKRHRYSLQKILIDSSERDDSDNGTAIARGWDHWLFNREMLQFITSGKVTKLRELGIAISQKDWHYFLRRLPLIPHIRTLYFPYIGKSAITFASSMTSVTDREAKELAHQVLDVVAVRPEIKLCYLAVANKCFEIIESRTTWSDLHLDEPVTPAHSPSDADTSDEGSADEDNDENWEGTDDGNVENQSQISEASEDLGCAEDSDEDEQTCIRLELREILFYDDRIAVFKARHGRL